MSWKISCRDIRSAWRLLPDLQVGVVHLRQDATYGVLVEVLRKIATARVGLSPAFASLAETGEGLRLARLARLVIAGGGARRLPKEIVDALAPFLSAPEA